MSQKLVKNNNEDSSSEFIVESLEFKVQSSMKKKDLIRFVIQTTISILTAIATALGAASCVGRV